jgi:hypothetical protein
MYVIKKSYSGDYSPLKDFVFTVVLDKTHWMMYWLVTAMYPQFLITVDEQLEEKAITVRVGQAVNTVGLAGQRMGISGVGFWADEVFYRVGFAYITNHHSSKRIKHLCGLPLGKEPNLEQTNTSLTPRHWRVS